jgi:hypothetical protein
VENRRRLLKEFRSACQELEDAGALESLDLTEAEFAELAAGVVVLPEPIREACQVVIDDWPFLGAGERVAALLVLANALAEASACSGPRSVEDHCSQALSNNREP